MGYSILLVNKRPEGISQSCNYQRMQLIIVIASRGVDYLIIFLDLESVGVCN